jgi:sulfoxide reductase catalytic subunit YedY
MQKHKKSFDVNGQALPKKHGFPLRMVAEGHYGSGWVKYVNRVKLEKI